MVFNQLLQRGDTGGFLSAGDLRAADGQHGVWNAFILRVLLHEGLQPRDGVAVGLGAVLRDAVPVLHIGIIGLIGVGFEVLRPRTVGFGIVAVLSQADGGIEALLDQLFGRDRFERAQTFVQRFVAVGLVGFELAHLSIELFNLAIGARERVR